MKGLGHQEMRQLLLCPLGLGSGQQRTTVPGQAILGPAHIENEEAGGTSQGPTGLWSNSSRRQRSQDSNRI